MALSRHIGTTRITASGSDQLSYWAASTRNTITTAKPKMIIAVLPAISSRYAISVHSNAHRRRAVRRSASSSMMSIASRELDARLAALPLIEAAGYML